MNNQYCWKNDAYVWMLILIPASAVVMGIIMLILAIKSDTGLVVDDYYRQGKEINRVLDRDNQASKMGLVATLRLDISRNRVHLTLESSVDIEPDQQLLLHFFHATRAGQDQTVVLRRVDGMDYAGNFTDLPPGRWDVQVSTEQWRLLASLQSPGRTNILLSSAVK